MFAIVPTSYVLGIAIVEDLGYLGSRGQTSVFRIGWTMPISKTHVTVFGTSLLEGLYWGESMSYMNAKHMEIMRFRGDGFYTPNTLRNFL